MGFFSAAEMKKEFHELIYNIILSLNQCGGCGVLKCEYCTKFVVDCNMCRERSCKNCVAFKTSKKILLENCNQHTKEYVANFLTDIFKVSDITYDFFNLSISETVKEKNYFFLSEKEIKKHANYLKIYNKVNYMVKGRKRTFFR